MKIMVIGGRGLIGSKLARRLRHDGHDPGAAPPGSGIDTLTGNGLAKSADRRPGRRRAGQDERRRVGRHRRALIARTRRRVRPRKESHVALADAAIHTIEHTRSAADPLALDPLSPIASPPDHRWFRPAH